MWFAYALKEPESGEIRYVGLSSVPQQRLQRHLWEARQGGRTQVGQWIRSLDKRGRIPTLEILENGDGDPVTAERRWISLLKANGASLTNATAGGEGVVSKESAVVTLRLPISTMALLRSVALKRTANGARFSMSAVIATLLEQHRAELEAAIPAKRC